MDIIESGISGPVPESYCGYPELLADRVNISNFEGAAIAHAVIEWQCKYLGMSSEDTLGGARKLYSKSIANVICHQSHRCHLQTLRPGVGYST
jgi:hypothetical protein